MSLSELVGKKVLVIEKDRAQVLKIKEQMALMETQVEIVKNHKQAVEKLNEQDFDFLVMNLSITNKSLKEFLDNIKNTLSEKPNFIISHDELFSGTRTKAGNQPPEIEILFNKDLKK
jgi:DNA-binding NtrC family response regulator